MARRASFKGAKHSRKKVAAATRKIGTGNKVMSIRVALSRQSGGDFFAAACVTGASGRMSTRGLDRRSNKRCAFRYGNTPTRATKLALAALAKSLK